MLKPILTEIREQFRLLGEVKRDPEYKVFVSGRVQVPAGSRKVLWSPEQWWEAFVFVFLCSGFEGGDDLLFFVYAPTHRARTLRSYFVKRKEEQLPEELQKGGERFSHVDWCETVALNLVLQTQYRLDVAVCGDADKDRVDNLKEELGEGAVRVSNKVFGSTTKAHLNPEASAAASNSAPEDCFPNICFAVEDFRDAFTSLVLSEPDQCYTVMLNAYGGPMSLAEFPQPKTVPVATKTPLSSSMSSDSYVKIPDAHALLPTDQSTPPETPQTLPETPSTLHEVQSGGGEGKSHPHGESHSDSMEPGTEVPGMGSGDLKTGGGETDGSWSMAGDVSGIHGEPGNGNESDCQPGPSKGIRDSCSGEGGWTEVGNGGASSVDGGSVGNVSGRENGSLASSSRQEPVMVRVFAGVVRCDALRIFMAAKEPIQKSKTVKMKRGDEGVAEVVVSFDCEDFPYERTSFNPIKMVREGVKGLGPKDALRKGLGLAAQAARDALNKQSQSRFNNNVEGIMALEELPLRCSLMTLSLPMPKLASQILDAVIP